MSFPSEIFLTILIVVTKIYERKILCGCFRFKWVWVLISIMKRCAERCAIQLYQTSLRMASTERKRSKYITARHYSPMNKFDLEIVLKRANGYLEPCQTSKIEIKHLRLSAFRK